MQDNIDFLPFITGSFAKPASENPTVMMIEAAYRYHNINARYLNCEVEPKYLADAIKGAKAMGWIGFNCSIPHKIAVVPYLDELGDSARLIGAVNTVVRRGDLWIGENTDGKGFLKALEMVEDPKGKHITIFGAGGAARAIAVELALAGAHTIIIVNRDKYKGNELVDLINSNTKTKALFNCWEGKYKVELSTNIVINATSIGLFPNVDQKLNVEFDLLRKEMIIADVIPNPPNTHFITTALEKGCRVLNGMSMLVNQGIIAIKYWMDVDVEPFIMHSELAQVLKTY
jgi:shikimate dehydrogenase (EC 1.1.1.25)